MAVRDLTVAEMFTLRAVVEIEEDASFGQKRRGALADGVAGWLNTHGAELDLSKEAARARLNRLADEGLLKKRPEGGNRVSYISLGAGRQALGRAIRARQPGAVA